MPDWSRIATRSRVPLGFAFAVVYLWFARPSVLFLGMGAAFTAAGVLVRAVASGHIRKNAELATTGPYAYTRNPLYLGSILIAVGFIVAARNLWIALAAAAMFIFIYLPVIRAEEAYLRANFPGYAEYAAAVPRLLPRLTAYVNASAADQQTGGFSRELYMKHREYEAALGSALMLAALAVKMFFFPH